MYGFCEVSESLLSTQLFHYSLRLLVVIVSLTPLPPPLLWCQAFFLFFFALLSANSKSQTVTQLFTTRSNLVIAIIRV